jgi:hypothetical protein
MTAHGYSELFTFWVRLKFLFWTHLVQIWWTSPFDQTKAPSSRTNPNQPAEAGNASANQL